jgi:hypothetical protein
MTEEMNPHYVLWISGPRRHDWKIVPVAGDMASEIMRLVGGAFELVPTPREFSAYCHAEGLERFPPYVRVMFPTHATEPSAMIHGPVVVFPAVDPANPSADNFTPDQLPLAELVFIPAQA